MLELVNRNQLACFCSEGTRICEICEICYGYLWIGIQNIQKRLLPGVVEWSRPQCNPGQPVSFIVAWKLHFRDWWETAAGRECRTNHHVECSRVPKYLTFSNILPVYPFLVLTQWQHLRMAKRPGGQLIEECRNLFEPHTLAIIQSLQSAILEGLEDLQRCCATVSKGPIQRIFGRSTCEEATSLEAFAPGMHKNTPARERQT